MYSVPLKTVVFFVLIQLAFPGLLLGAEFNVTNQAELEDALRISATNKQDDTIRIMDGADLEDVPYTRELGYSLTIKGGYAPDFKSRVTKRKLRSAAPEAATAMLASTSPNTSSIRTKTTSGPTPPDGVKAKTTEIISFALGAPESDSKILGAPGYFWRHGCAGTAYGMLAGYYDARGYPDLIEGDADTQTNAVNHAIASDEDTTEAVEGVRTNGHYEDYSQPLDSNRSIPLTDNSENGGAHANNSIADHMNTSQSLHGLNYGYTWDTDMDDGFRDWVTSRNANYTFTSTVYAYPALSWDVYTNEIDNDRPVPLFVDSNADGWADHVVLGVGYRTTDSVNEYGCLDTWSPAATVRWATFQGEGAGNSYGIWKGTTYELSGQCTYALSTAAIGAPTSGGTYTVDVTSNCGWDVTETASWISVTPTQGTGDATLSVTVDPNTTDARRTATITVDTLTIEVSQAVSHTDITPSLLLLID